MTGPDPSHHAFCRKAANAARPAGRWVLERGDLEGGRHVALFGRLLGEIHEFQHDRADRDRCGATHNLIYMIMIQTLFKIILDTKLQEGTRTLLKLMTSTVSHITRTTPPCNDDA